MLDILTFISDLIAISILSFIVSSLAAVGYVALVFVWLIPRLIDKLSGYLQK